MTESGVRCITAWRYRNILFSSVLSTGECYYIRLFPACQQSFAKFFNFFSPGFRHPLSVRPFSILRRADSLYAKPLQKFSGIAAALSPYAGGAAATYRKPRLCASGDPLPRDEKSRAVVRCRKCGNFPMLYRQAAAIAFFSYTASVSRRSAS